MGLQEPRSSEKGPCGAGTYTCKKGYAPLLLVTQELSGRPPTELGLGILRMRHPSSLGLVSASGIEKEMARGT